MSLPSTVIALLLCSQLVAIKAESAALDHNFATRDPLLRRVRTFLVSSNFWLVFRSSFDRGEQPYERNPATNRVACPTN